MSPPTNDYPAFSPYLTVHDAAAAIEFYKAAFGATERFRLTTQGDGKIGHAELSIEGGLIMLNDENPQWGNKSPRTLGGTSVTHCWEVEDADAAFDRAIAAGATVQMPVTDQFYGFRSGCLIDPFGHQWMIQKQIEKLTPGDLRKRWDAMSGGCGGNGPE